MTLKDAQTNVTSIVTQALSISIYTEIISIRIDIFLKDFLLPAHPMLYILVQEYTVAMDKSKQHLKAEDYS